MSKVIDREDLVIGETYILDEGFRNSSKVVLLNLTPRKMFATVAPIDNPIIDNSWDVMAYRLSHVENN